MYLNFQTETENLQVFSAFYTPKVVVILLHDEIIIKVPG